MAKFTGKKFLQVSIQLMSPASGDYVVTNGAFTPAANVSIQLMSPASGDMLRVRGICPALDLL